MKYIRTKDGIWETMEIKPNYENVYYHCKHNLIGKRFEEKEIIQQADTIEELCDAWIIIPKGVNCNPFVRNIFEDISHFINSDHIVFAAIWCRGDNDEPILKAVAKLNEKGKAELL